MSLLGALVWLSSYLVGSIPFGYLLARARGVDIFAHGSGNIGATNVGRVLGRPFGILVFLLDFAKGAIPTAVAGHLVSDDEGLVMVGAGLAAFLGHLYPVYLGFRGGKGVATGAGVVAVLFPLPALVAILIWLAVAASTRYVSLASVLAVVALVAVYLLPRDFDFADPRTLFALFAGGLVIVKHRANISRLRVGAESQLKENSAMQPVARSMHVLSLGLWLGMGVFFNFIVGLSLFHTFEALGEKTERPAWFPRVAEYSRVDADIKVDGPKEQGSRAFGAAVGPLFSWYFLLQGTCAFVALGTALGWTKFGRLHRVRVWILGVALLLAMIGWPIERYVTSLRVERNAITDTYLSADSARAAEIRPQVVEARSRFFVWHQVSLFSSLATVVLVIAATALAGQLPADEK
ncbi:MAG TPA: glycerol-3-phosphate 1-O-acyltransferase PlsY [Gemmataceae bacterium]|nr:glycerol-3-phosphate 1-O-acyltransferase PlsY [Gemmataceae bacterium]